MVFQRPVTFAGTVLDNLREADRDCDDGARRRAARARRPAGELPRARRRRAVGRRGAARVPGAGARDRPARDAHGRADVGAGRARRRRCSSGSRAQLVDDGTPVVWVTHSRSRCAGSPTTCCCSRDGRVDRSGSRATRCSAMDSAGDVGCARPRRLARARRRRARDQPAAAAAPRARARRRRVVRGFVQLLIVGAALAIIIDPDTPLVWSWLWVAGIVVFAAATVQPPRARRARPVLDRARRQRRRPRSSASPSTFGLGIFPVEGRTLVPIAGMLDRQRDEVGDRRRRAARRGAVGAARRGRGAPRARSAVDARRRGRSCAASCARRCRRRSRTRRRSGSSSCRAR